ncbi:MAG TPA: class I SAM-dependent methyltransferase [Ktedonobacteraceae bacterium]
MLKYIMTATALKAFSLSPQTRQGYRFLGNTLGQKKRIQAGLSREYINRAKNILALYDQYLTMQPGARVLEIGTGWVHWEATILRLFYDVEITLFDIWDNRHFEAYKCYCQKLDEIIDSEIELEPARRARVHGLLEEIQNASTFDDIYAILNFTYVVNPQGTLDVFADQSFDLITSSNVLEHVDKAILPAFTQDFYRILKVGGYSIHQIDLGDHLSYYDQRARAKNYLRYDDTTWKRFFENDVQYFNRVQKPLWMEMFQASKLELVNVESVDVDLKALPIAQSYQDINAQDLRCWTLRVVHTRPR